MYFRQYLLKISSNAKCHLLFLCCSLKFFYLSFAFLFFYVFIFISLFLSNLFSTYRKNLRKTRYQTSDLLLSLVITIEAVVFTYSNQKILTFCNFAIFYILRYNSLGPQFQFSWSIFLKLYEVVNLCLTHWDSSLKVIKVYKSKF